MKLYIVYGAPCSGKSTYVKKHIGNNDLVYDYDELVRTLTYGKEHTVEKGNVHKYVIDFRKRILQRAKQETELDNIWVISTFLTEQFKEYIKDMNPQYIKMDETKETCLERLMNDDARPDKEKWAEKINEWFERYQSEQRKKQLILKMDLLDLERG